MRREQTDAERRMWSILRNGRLGGHKFRRQLPVCGYIVDFYCIESRVVVELDGGQHSEPSQKKYDDKRTCTLKEGGITVLRFWDHVVLKETDTVARAIYGCLQNSKEPSPQPSPGVPGEGAGGAPPTGAIMRLILAIAIVVFALAAPAQDKAPPSAKDVKPSPAAAAEDPPKKELDPAHMKTLAEALGAKPGETKGKVHTITLPRTDLGASTLEFGDIPVEAGLQSTFHVWRCTCGKYYIIGQFCVIDYESNDVIDALRANNRLYIASVAPMLLQERPRLLLIRFQGEGDIDTIAKNLKEALRWIGDARTKPNPIKKDE
jgi:very-short-patch-repair endonuclease